MRDKETTYHPDGEWANKGWAGMKDALDKEMPVRKRRRWLPFLLILPLVIGGTFYTFNKIKTPAGLPTPNANETAVVSQDKLNIIDNIKENDASISILDNTVQGGNVGLQMGMGSGLDILAKNDNAPLSVLGGNKPVATLSGTAAGLSMNNSLPKNSSPSLSGMGMTGMGASSLGLGGSKLLGGGSFMSLPVFSGKNPLETTTDKPSLLGGGIDLGQGASLLGDSLEEPTKTGDESLLNTVESNGEAISEDVLIDEKPEDIINENPLLEKEETLLDKPAESKVIALLPTPTASCCQNAAPSFGPIVQKPGRKWSYGVGLGFNFQQIKDLGSDFEFFAARRISPKWRFYMGMGYRYQYFNSNAGGLLFGAQQEDLALEPEPPLTGNNEVFYPLDIHGHYLQVPARFGYRFHRKWEVRFGASAEFLLKENILQDLPPQQGAFTGIGQYDYSSSSRINPVANASLIWYPAPRWGLGLGYDMGLTRRTFQASDGSPVSLSPYSSYSRRAGLSLLYHF